MRAMLERFEASPNSPKRAASYVSGAVISTVAGGALETCRFCVPWKDWRAGALRNLMRIA